MGKQKKGSNKKKKGGGGHGNNRAGNNNGRQQQQERSVGVADQQQARQTEIRKAKWVTCMDHISTKSLENDGYYPLNSALKKKMNEGGGEEAATVMNSLSSLGIPLEIALASTPPTAPAADDGSSDALKHLLHRSVVAPETGQCPLIQKYLLFQPARVQETVSAFWDGDFEIKANWESKDPINVASSGGNGNDQVNVLVWNMEGRVKLAGEGEKDTDTTTTTTIRIRIAVHQSKEWAPRPNLTNIDYNNNTNQIQFHFDKHLPPVRVSFLTEIIDNDVLARALGITVTLQQQQPSDNTPAKKNGHYELGIRMIYLYLRQFAFSLPTALQLTMLEMVRAQYSDITSSSGNNINNNRNNINLQCLYDLSLIPIDVFQNTEPPPSPSPPASEAAAVGTRDGAVVVGGSSLFPSHKMSLIVLMGEVLEAMGYWRHAATMYESAAEIYESLIVSSNNNKNKNNHDDYYYSPQKLEYWSLYKNAGLACKHGITTTDLSTYVPLTLKYYIKCLSLVNPNDVISKFNTDEEINDLISSFYSLYAQLDALSNNHRVQEGPHDEPGQDELLYLGLNGLLGYAGFKPWPDTLASTVFQECFETGGSICIFPKYHSPKIAKLKLKAIFASGTVEVYQQNILMVVRTNLCIKAKYSSTNLDAHAKVIENRREFLKSNTFYIEDIGGGPSNTGSSSNNTLCAYCMSRANDEESPFRYSCTDGGGLFWYCSEECRDKQLQFNNEQEYERLVNGIQNKNISISYLECDRMGGKIKINPEWLGGSWSTKVEKVGYGRRLIDDLKRVEW